MKLNFKLENQFLVLTIVVLFVIAFAINTSLSNYIHNLFIDSRKDVIADFINNQAK